MKTVPIVKIARNMQINATLFFVRFNLVIIYYSDSKLYKNSFLRY